MFVLTILLLTKKLSKKTLPHKNNSRFDNFKFLYPILKTWSTYITCQLSKTKNKKNIRCRLVIFLDFEH